MNSVGARIRSEAHRTLAWNKSVNFSGLGALQQEQHDCLASPACWEGEFGGEMVFNKIQQAPKVLSPKGSHEAVGMMGPQQ